MTIIMSLCHNGTRPWSFKYHSTIIIINIIILSFVVNLIQSCYFKLSLASPVYSPTSSFALCQSPNHATLLLTALLLPLTILYFVVNLISLQSIKLSLVSTIHPITGSSYYLTITARTEPHCGK